MGGFKQSSYAVNLHRPARVTAPAHSVRTNNIRMVGEGINSET